MDWTLLALSTSWFPPGYSSKCNIQTQEYLSPKLPVIEWIILFPENIHYLLLVIVYTDLEELIFKPLIHISTMSLSSHSHLAFKYVSNTSHTSAERKLRLLCNKQSSRLIYTHLIHLNWNSMWGKIWVDIDGSVNSTT